MDPKLLDRFERTGGNIYMKIRVTLAVLLFAGLFASSCATVTHLNAEYEEEMGRVATMSPAAKEEWQKAEDERTKTNWNEYSGGSDGDN
jgi:hypothetical protein